MNNNLFYGWKFNLISAIALTPGLLLTSQEDALSKRKIPDNIKDQDLDEIIVPHQQFPIKLIPKQTLTQVPSAPNPIPPRGIEPLEIPNQELEPEPEIPLEINPAEIPSPTEELKIPGTITVKEFLFEGNSENTFSDQELQEVVKDYTNRPLSFSELLLVEEEIRNKYTAGCQDNGSQEPCYINSGAFIPANQTFSQNDAVVKVQIVEGSIVQINITGLTKLNEGYVRSRLEKGISQPFNQKELLDELRILQLDPLVQNLAAELTAGSRQEESILDINILEADSFDVDIITNNGRAPSVGTWRRSLRLTEGNLFGIGDRIFGEYTNTDGSNKIDLGYFIPLNANNTTISLAGGINKTEVVEEPFDRLDIEGDSFNIEVGLRHPILRTPTKEFALGITGTRQESKTQLQGADFPLSSGANNNGETRISALRFYQEYTKKDLDYVFAVRSQFNVGLDVFDATFNENPLPDSRFFAWRGQGQYVRRLSPNSLLVLRSDLQLAGTNLVPLEQFSIGGADSVRGYRQDSILTDNGLFTSAEVRLPILKVQEVDGLLQIAPFLDLGIGWDSSDDEDPEDQTFIGLGLGLRWKMGDEDNFTARLDYGIPLIDVDDSDETLQENGLYFSINYRPF
ncbi:MAG: ShlB/FhaC/HecB family hemolysin secretion/activation protein [Cyanobacteria bacterium P01_F01_bin.143]